MGYVFIEFPKDHLLAVLTGRAVRVFAAFATSFERHDTTAVPGYTIGIRNTRHTISSRGNTFIIPIINENIVEQHECDIHATMMSGTNNRLLAVLTSWTVWILATFATSFERNYPTTMPRCTIRVRNARQSISSWSDTFSIPIEEEQFESYKDTSFNILNVFLSFN